MADLAVRLPWATLKNPIMPGAGPVVDGGAEIAAAAAGGVGALLTGTMLVEPPPVSGSGRTQVSKGSLIHRQYGSRWSFAAWLESEGPAALAAARAQGIPLIASVGFSAAAVRQMGPRLEALGVDALELSLHETERGDAVAVAAALRQSVRLPVIAKLSPHHGEDLAEFAAELEPYVDAFTCINSFGPVLSLDVATGGSSLTTPLGLGYLSGATIRPIAQRFVFEVAQRVSRPVIASGGVTSGRDAIEMLMVGASAVQVSTHALLGGTGVYSQILSEMNEWLDGHGYQSVAEVIGAYGRKYGAGQRVVLEKEESPQLNAEGCVRCSLCQQVCTYGAIYAPVKHLPEITYEACTQCGLCVSACPADALSFRPRDTVTLSGEKGGAA